MAYSGLFRPQHPEKYRGRVDQVVWRSLWELNYFKRLDTNPDVLEWSSEETVIPYQSTDGKIHKYFPDLRFTIRQPDGTLKTFLVEIKPLFETLPPMRTKPVRTQRQYQRLLKETDTFLKNQSKWKAAREWCARHDMEFVLLTEKELFPGRTV